MPKLRQIMEALDNMAPWDWAESWDRVGLQMGDPDQTVNKVLVAVDINQQVLEEGLAKKVDGFIVHHPLIFKPVTQINLRTPLGSYLHLLLKNGLFLIAAHTNMDKSPYGINQFLAECLNLDENDPLEPVKSEYYKVVTFSPGEYASKIRQAMSEAGAGVIGNYSGCSFHSSGTGAFTANTCANPFIGQPEHLEEVTEYRIEMVASHRDLSKIFKAIITAHPYEEPAIDCYPLLDYLHKNPDAGAGLGRIGTLPEPMTLEALCDLVREKLAAKSLRVTGAPQRKISRMAICSGSGGSLVQTVIQKGADLYLTGELGYHDHLTLRESGLSVIEAGHWTTEYCFIRLVGEYLKKFFSGEEAFEVLPCGVIQGEPFRNY